MNRPAMRIAITLLLLAIALLTARAAPGFFDFWMLPKIWIAAILCITALILLVSGRVRRNLRLVFMILAFFAFGVLSALPLGEFARGMGLHPSPLCVVEKPFLFLESGRGVPLVFISVFTYIALLTIAGNKLFCGWVCPVGALQEIVHRLPLPDRWRVRIPFRISNGLRIALLLAFFLLLFSAGRTLYDPINPFHMLHWHFSWAVVIPFAVVLLLSLPIYRPFCYLACPLGLVTWGLEHLSLFRVRLDRKVCTDCALCLKKSPCPAVGAVLDQSRSRPDCHACGRCIEVCPEDALSFK